MGETLVGTNEAAERMKKSAKSSSKCVETKPMNLSTGKSSASEKVSKHAIGGVVKERRGFYGNK